MLNMIASLPDGLRIDEAFGSLRQQILQQLLEHRAGQAIEELSKHLGISRTAVQKHFLVLEKQGLIKKHNRVKTLGRPCIIYVLTEQGIAYFPKRYAMFSEVLLQELKNELGSEQLSKYMQKLGKKLASQYQLRFAGQNDAEQNLTLLALLQELGFYADLEIDAAAQTVDINAHNCIYHDVAQQFHEVCSLDQAFVAELLNKPTELQSCMAKGGGVCCFRICSEKGRNSLA
ncbi:MAG: HTH domain-containing protein [Methylococcales bacterium]